MFTSLLLSGAYFLKYAAFLISYLSNSNAFPRPLTQKEEQKHLEQARNGGEESKNILIEHNLRLVAHIVKKYSSNTYYDTDDLISIGSIGLIKAIHSFDYTKKTRLATYAAKCIENAIITVRQYGIISTGYLNAFQEKRWKKRTRTPTFDSVM